MSLIQTVEPAVSSLDDLNQWLATADLGPLDATHLAAILEMNGWTDRRAVSLGYEDVFALAEAVYPKLYASVQSQSAAPSDIAPWHVRTFRVVRLYLRGLVFALPMVLSSLSVLTLKYSVWSYVGFSTEIATGIALGTFASFLLAGGFTQAIARRGLFYLSQNQPALARRSSLQLLIIGFLVVIASLLLGLAGFVLVPLLPWPILRISIVYGFLLSAIWLGTALLYMLQQELIILPLIAAGIGLVYWQFEWLNMPMVQAHVLAMTTIAAGSILIALHQMQRLAGRRDFEGQNIKGLLPRWSQTSRSLAPYFIFGVLYFSLLFADRLVAWSVPGEFHPYIIWFLGDYELGLDWALWTLVLPIGLAEVHIHALFRRISARQPSAKADSLSSFNRRFRYEHLYITLLILAFGIISMVLLVFLIGELYRYGLLEASPLSNPVTRLVFFGAAPAYGMIAAGLLNSLILFSLNVPWPVVTAVLWSLAADLLAGFLASRYGGYQWAVLGLLAGAAIFAALSFRAAYRVLGRLDYYLMRLV